MSGKRRELECIDSATGQETQLAILGTTERALYTVQSIRNVLRHDALQKEPESYGSVEKLREAGGIHRPELDGTREKCVEYSGRCSIVQGLGSVNPYSYPCRHIRASDLWCQRRRDVITLRLGMSPYHGRSGDPRRVRWREWGSECRELVGLGDGVGLEPLRDGRGFDESPP